MPARRRPAGVVLFGLLVFAAMTAAPAYLSLFSLNLLGQYLALAIAALGLDLLWGYAGVLSLGQSVFFGLGGYGAAMYLKLASLTPRALPDFMTWSGVTELPALWRPFTHFGGSVVMIVAVPGAVAALTGMLVFRSRIKGVYFSILTQALAVIASTLCVDRQNVTGGSSGITGFSHVLGAPLFAPKTQRWMYEITLLVLGLAFIGVSLLAGSSFGKTLQAVRDGENRIRFCGYDPAAYKTAAFVLAGVLAAVSGALYVPQNGIIAPAMLGVVPAIEIVIWVAVGGRGTVIGAVVGTLFVNYAKHYLSIHFPNVWLYFIGILFVLVVLVFPEGLVGLARWVTRLARSSRTAGEEHGPKPA